jgi:glycosyltransferase involved in cell wall biosynthesis
MIDIIVPFFNGEKHIDFLLSSVAKANLRYSNIHGRSLLSSVIIVVDSVSTDQFFFDALVTTFKDIEIEVIRNQDNIGVAATRNIGYKRSTADYVLFIDQDDSLSEDYFLTIDDFLFNYEIIFTNGTLVSEQYSFRWFYRRPIFSVDGFIRSFNVRSPGMYLLRRTLNNIFFPEDRNISGADDKFFLIDLYILNPDISSAYVDAPLYVGRLHNSNVSNDYKKLATACLYYWDNFRNELRYRRFQKSIAFDIRVQKYIQSNSLIGFLWFYRSKLSLNSALRFSAKLIHRF